MPESLSTAASRETAPAYPGILACAPLPPRGVSDAPSSSSTTTLRCGSTISTSCADDLQPARNISPGGLRTPGHAQKVVFRKALRPYQYSVGGLSRARLEPSTGRSGSGEPSHGLIEHNQKRLAGQRLSGIVRRHGRYLALRREAAKLGRDHGGIDIRGRVHREVPGRAGATVFSQAQVVHPAQA